MSLQPPKEVSSNGQEIWDWAARLGNAVQAAAKIKDTRAQANRMERECGSCTKWMSSSECPREVNVRGRNQGPSCASMKCGEFQMEPRIKTLIDKLRAEADALAASLAASPKKGQDQ